MRLHEWVFPLAAWRAPHGLEGGEVNESTAVVEERSPNIGATVMGRNMFGGGRAWARRAVERLVGRQPALPPPGFRAHAPRARAAHVRGRHDLHVRHRRDRGGARAGARGGGRKGRVARRRREAARQYLAAGLVDEMEISLVPIFLGGGERLFEGSGRGSRVRHTPDGDRAGRDAT